MRRFTVFILLTVFLGLSLASAEQVLAGKVKKIRGTVFVTFWDTGLDLSKSFFTGLC